MNIRDVAVPSVYKESADFRFFLDWFSECLAKIQYDTENLSDLYDPERCPRHLLWMLCDTIGYRYDDRLPAAFNRLVLLYFMSIIRNRGSKDGVTLAAELNLAQLKILNKIKTDDIYEDRLSDTSIPVNSAYVTPHPDLGYIDVVYFSTETPVDACIDYARPLGMYCFQMPGVRLDARTKIVIDTKLADAQYNSEGVSMDLSPTHVGHYSRNDYAKMQKMDVAYKDGSGQSVSPSYGDRRDYVYARNSEADGEDITIKPGYRTLESLQMCNNMETMKALLPNIFSIGYAPVMTDGEPYDNPDKDDRQPWNLQDNIVVEGSPSFTRRFDAYGDGVTTVYKIADTTRYVYALVTSVRVLDGHTYTFEVDPTSCTVTFDTPPADGSKIEIDFSTRSDIYTINTGTKYEPAPRVNPAMTKLGDAMPN